MKKCISIILALVILINIEGSYLIYCILRFSVRNETWTKIRNGIDENDLCIIDVPTTTKSDILWIEKDKEFLYKWQMYDVVKIKREKDFTTYYCLNDEKEKQLVDNYLKNHNNGKESEKHLKKIPFLEFIPFKKSLLKHILPSQSLKFSFISNYQFEFLKIPSPPPKPEY